MEEDGWSLRVRLRVLSEVLVWLDGLNGSGLIRHAYKNAKGAKRKEGREGNGEGFCLLLLTV